jgi:hypothetical protein
LQRGVLFRIERQKSRYVRARHNFLVIVPATTITFLKSVYVNFYSVKMAHYQDPERVYKLSGHPKLADYELEDIKEKGEKVGSGKYTEGGHIYYFVDKKLHRTDGPAYIVKGTNLTEEWWFQNGVFGRDESEGPAYRQTRRASEGLYIERYYFENGNVKKSEYIVNGDNHRVDGPAIIYYFENGNVKKSEYIVNGYNHRVDGPAIIKYNKDGTVRSSEYYWRGEAISKEEHKQKANKMYEKMQWPIIDLINNSDESTKKLALLKLTNALNS